MLIVNLVADLLVILPVAVLCAYQTYYISTNTTTIESWEKDRVQSMCRRKILPPCPFPYDLGLLRNFRSVLGGNFLLWLWPLYSADGDGINFETKAGFKGGNTALSDISHLSIYLYISMASVRSFAWLRNRWRWRRGCWERRCYSQCFYWLC